MKIPSSKNILRSALLLFIAFYLVAALLVSQREYPPLTSLEKPTVPFKIAIFGASGTAGDGILKAALANSYISEILVVTRRETPRIQEGVTSGKVEMVRHTDYLDYSPLAESLTDIDAVFWAIGISSLGMDQKAYAKIHVDFPMAFVKTWHQESANADTSFHYISSSDISDESSAMWAKEKIRAEKSLFAFAADSKLRVIAYRPDYIGPTKEQAHIGQTILYWFFKPVGAAVRATQIGEAMIDIALRGNEISNGSKLSTAKILRHSANNASKKMSVEM